MRKGGKKPASINEYILAAPKGAQKNLRALRGALKKVAPKAREVIKWGMPMFEEKRILFAFGGFKDHISLMPTPSAVQRFQKELKKYKTGKGSIQFPLDAPLPRPLITKIAAYRLKESREKDARWM